MRMSMQLIDAGAQRLAPIVAGVDVWRIDLDALAPLADIKLLSEDERHRAERLRFERDRGRYLAAHFVLRVLLGRALARAPETLVFTEAEFGKPRLAVVHAAQLGLFAKDAASLVHPELRTADVVAHVDVEVPGVVEGDLAAGMTGSLGANGC